MKRTIVLTTLLLIGSLTLQAQDFHLEDAYQQDVKIRKTGMLILGSWAVGNLLIGSIGRQNTVGTQKYFHEMNAFWNVVNLGIAGAGYYFTLKGDVPASSAAFMSDQISFQKILLFNAGLDIAYIVGGLYMLEKSKNSLDKADRWKGYGRSLLLQGAFLLSFDLILHQVHQKNTTQFTDFLSHLYLSPQQIGWVHTF